MSRRGYFGGMNGSSPVDYAARYTQDMQMPTLPLNMESIIRSGSSRDPGADDRLESALQKAVREGEGTITGYVYGYDNRVRKIKDLLQNDERNFIEAENLYKDLQTVASANQDALLTLSGYGNSRSVTAKALADSAAKLKSGSYNDEVVTLSDGRQTSIGQLFGGSGYMANRSRQLSRYGFGANVSEAYLGEDADKSEAVGMFVLPVISGPRIDASNSETRSMQFSADVNPYRIQMNDGAAFVADNYDRMRSRLGVDGTRRLIQDVMKNQGNSGGMTYMMRGIMDYLDKTGEKDADGTPVPIANGYKWVSDFTSAYNETYQALFKDPKSPSPAGYDERQNQFLTQAFLKIMEHAGAPGDPEFDFRKPEVRRAIQESAAVYARARSDGYDLDSVSRISGHSAADDLGKRVVNASKGIPPPADDIITWNANLVQQLNSSIEGGPIVSELRSVMTGRDSFYDRDAASANGGRSVSESADRMKKKFVGAIAKNLTPHGATGLRQDDALRAVFLDPEYSKQMFSDCVEAVSSEIAGSGGRELAAMLYNRWRGSMISGVPTEDGPFSFTREIERLVKSNRTPATTRERAALNAAKAWYYSNVAAPDRYTEERTALSAHLQSSFGGRTKEQADREASLVSQMDARARLSNTGGSPLAIASNRGVVYTPRRDKRGNLMYYDAVTGEPSNSPSDPNARPLIDARMEDDLANVSIEYNGVVVNPGDWNKYEGKMKMYRLNDDLKRIYDENMKLDFVRAGKKQDD